MTPQEIIDCLNGLATIDCDLQTAYAYIKGQQEKLALTEKALELACQDMDCEDCPLNETICDSWRGVEDGCSKAIAKCYLEEAKEMMKSE